MCDVEFIYMFDVTSVYMRKRNYGSMKGRFLLRSYQAVHTKHEIQFSSKYEVCYVMFSYVQYVQSMLGAKYVQRSFFIPFYIFFTV